MANLLYLVHRIPYPPDKGDKVRSYHLLRHLSAAGHRVHLGTFIDDPRDEQHAGTARALCASAHFARLRPWQAKLRSLTSLLRGEPLTLGYYRDEALARWVRQTLATERIDAAVVFSSSMVQYVDGEKGLRLLVDFVDVDSAKWSQYAGDRAWPLSWLYRREGRRLLGCERAAAQRADQSFFVTEKETELFRQLAPESAGRCEALRNGVDAEFFAPDATLASPYRGDEIALVFTGAMDYHPNIDAVCWFVADMLPALRARWPSLRFHIVGRNPAPSVRALAGPAVNVTGTVPDVRPWLQHASVVVAPLRLARGIQNKVLEAMAMGRPVVAAQECAAAIQARLGIELLAAPDAEGFVQEIAGLLRDPWRAIAIGAAGRRRALADFGWEANLGTIERHLASREAAPPLAA
jgi:sugar transferase (PEP-CTERM/EpsH1 system associated)